MFGDNLSFISDTTIAACNGQGCEMKDKFKENFFIALPAAIASLVIILLVLSVKNYNGGFIEEKYDLIQIIPYILVLIGGIIGFNVFFVLITGILSGSSYYDCNRNDSAHRPARKYGRPVLPECLKPVWLRFW